MMDYSSALNKIMAVPMFQKIGAVAFMPTLDGINRLVGSVDNPQTSFQTIHIAGTNGKGSVSNMLSSVLMEAGYRVGCYTSPHLSDYRERVRINGEMVREELVADFVERVEPIIDNFQPSFFEITTALAFYAFKQEGVDIAVIECGLGGLTDSTNIISPLVSVITNIGFDHKNILGDAIAEIAFQKGGIIKKDTPVIIGEHGTESDRVFIDIANEKGAELIFAQDKLSAIAEDDRNEKFRVSEREITMSLRGDYQKNNLITLLATIDTLKSRGLEISEKAIKDGIFRVTENMEFVGRWYTFSDNPLTICDTGHNEDGIRYITSQLSKAKYKKLYIIIGFMADKEVNKILKMFPQDAYYLFTTASNPRSMLGEELKVCASNFSLKGESFSNMSEAYTRAVELAESDDMIFVGGSTFITADFLSLKTL